MNSYSVLDSLYKHVKQHFEIEFYICNIVSRRVRFCKSYLASGNAGCRHTFREASEACAEWRYGLQVCVPNRERRYQILLRDPTHLANNNNRSFIFRYI